MKSNDPLYYVIVYRPKLSRTWTPVEDRYWRNGNFFATELRALDGMMVMKYQDNEYRVAKVLLVDD